MENNTFFELRWGKAMVAYTKPQQRKKEESKRLRGERSDQVYWSCDGCEDSVDCRTAAFTVLAQLCGPKANETEMGAAYSPKMVREGTSNLTSVLSTSEFSAQKGMEACVRIFSRLVRCHILTISSQHATLDTLRSFSITEQWPSLFLSSVTPPRDSYTWNYRVLACHAVFFSLAPFSRFLRNMRRWR